MARCQRGVGCHGRPDRANGGGKTAAGGQVGTGEMTRHDTSELAPYAATVLRDAAIPELPGHYSGKVRENYDLPDGRRLIIATDRLSAFDRILTAVPLKGQVLNQIARHWFEATADI